MAHTPSSKKSAPSRASTSKSPSYAELAAQIAELQRQADEARRAEVTEVVRNIKEAIAQYGLTASDLGLSGRGKAGKAPAVVGVKYTDGVNTWSGRGRRPRWLLEALEAGETESDLQA